VRINSTFGKCVKKWLRQIFGDTSKRKTSLDEANAIRERQFNQLGLLIACSKLGIGPERLPIRHAVRYEGKNVADSG
jgi:hypothetical protein